MDRYTTISSENTKLSTKRIETVGGMIFCNNLKISFLPLLVHKTFPNLLGYSAASCSIKSISYHNFKSLTKLRELWLLKNKIETIYSNTFEDLASLERLDLRKFSHARQSSDLKNVLIGLGGNHIKFMNGKAFLNLKVLTEVWLLQNSCISKYSFGLENIEEMAEEITQKCKFAEIPPRVSRKFSTLNAENLLLWKIASLVELKQSEASGRSWWHWSAEKANNASAVEVSSHHNMSWRVRQNISLDYWHLKFHFQLLIAFKTKSNEKRQKLRTWLCILASKIWQKNQKTDPLLELLRRFMCIQIGESGRRNGMLT